MARTKDIILFRLRLARDISIIAAIEMAKNYHCAGIAWTYNEPTMWFEYTLDSAKLARENGLYTVYVTNGYMTGECLDEMKGLLDAANVDVKSFDEKTYKRVCGANLAPVLDSIERMRALGIWVEITTLVIPTVNDSEKELRDIARWIRSTDPTMPWHISAFYPSYKMTGLPPTPVKTIDRARQIGLAEGLRYVYTGNIPGDEGESTFCYGCKGLLIKRFGFRVISNRIEKGRCPSCGVDIDGVEL